MRRELSHSPAKQNKVQLDMICLVLICMHIIQSYFPSLIFYLFLFLKDVSITGLGKHRVKEHV